MNRLRNVETRTWRWVVLACGLALSASAALAGQKATSLGGAVFSPEKGVVCDRKAGFCADGTGISMSWTEKYLGNEAAAKFAKRMDANYDITWFVFSNGVECKTAQRACYKQKGSDKKAHGITKALFP